MTTTRNSSDRGLAGTGIRRPGFVRLVPILAAILAAASAIGSPLSSSERDSQLEEAFALLGCWDVKGAEGICKRLKASGAGPALAPLETLLAYHAGDYPRTAMLADRAGKLCAGDLGREMQRLGEAARKTPEFEEEQGEHFVFRHTRGPDAVLALYAMSVLEAARERIGKVLDFKPDNKILVEVYPDLDSFSRASTLSAGEISTSGAVAICRWGRIMICSPRLMLRGYPWQDTLTHEYVHYCIVRLSKNRAPVWLHEAFARQLESLWRDDGFNALTPGLHCTLHDALRERAFISLEEMSPSLATLGSRKRTELAFAQVQSMAGMLETECGRQVYRRLLDLVAGGEKADAACAKVLGIEEDGLWQHWVEYLQRDPPKAERVVPLFPRLASGAEAVVPEETIGAIRVERARDFVLLGDMLRPISPAAAVVEYTKAESAAGGPNPGLLIRLAGAHMDCSRYSDAEAVLKQALKCYPDYVTAQALLGRLHLLRDESAAARDALERAVGNNPFDPAIHADLLRACRMLGDEAAVSRETAALRILSRNTR